MSTARELTIQSQIKTALSGPGSNMRLFRNVTACVWVGRIKGRTKDGCVILHPGAHQINVGLHTGSADLIGWREVVATEGQRVAQFLSVEVKREKGGVTSTEQERWKQVVNEAGGLAVVANSVETATEAVR